MSNYLVTGAAGFIGARTTEMLIEQGHTVVGVDNMNDAYDVRIKEYRLKRLQALQGFEFIRADISERSVLAQLAKPQIRCGHQPGSAGRRPFQRGKSLGFP